MSRPRDRVVRTAGTRGELTLYELDHHRDHLRPLHAALRPSVDRGARRQVDRFVVQIVLSDRAEPRQEGPQECHSTARTKTRPLTSGENELRKPVSP
jgi:hypothetical protein